MILAEKQSEVNGGCFLESESKEDSNKNRRLRSMTLQDGYSKSEIDLKLDKIESNMHHGFENVKLRFQHLETEIDRRFQQVDERFKQVDERFEKVDERFNQMENRFNQFQEQMTTMIGQLDQSWDIKLENYFYKQEVERRKERRIFLRWLIGFGLMLLISVLSNFISFYFK